MLVNLAFVVERLKKYQEKIVMINKDGGGGEGFLDFIGQHSCYEGGTELMGVLPLPLIRNTLVTEKKPRSSTCFENISNISRE